MRTRSGKDLLYRYMQRTTTDAWNCGRTDGRWRSSPCTTHRPTTDSLNDPCKSKTIVLSAILVVNAEAEKRQSFKAFHCNCCCLQIEISNYTTHVSCGEGYWFKIFAVSVGDKMHGLAESWREAFGQARQLLLGSSLVALPILMR